MAFPDKSMAPKPPAGMADAPQMPGMDDQPEEKAEGASLEEIKSLLMKIISALGLDEADQQEPDQPQVPMGGAPDDQQ